MSDDIVKKKVSIMIPVYNEEEVLPFLYERLVSLIDSQTSYKWEILFVNDGSTDNTLSILLQMHFKDSRINVIDLSRNYGKEIAMLAGFDYVTGDCMINLDADLQDPPELIPEMLEYWEQGYDDVYAKRRTREGESWMKRLTAHVFYLILQKTTNIKLQRDTGDFRLLDKNCIEAL